MRVIFLALVVLIALTLLVDGILIHSRLSGPWHAQSLPGTPSNPAVTPASASATSVARGRSATPVTPGSRTSSTPGSGTASITPMALNFSATQGGMNPAAQAVTISASGSDAASWQVSVSPADSPWLSSDPAAGSISAGQAQQALVHVDANRLAPGTYSGQLSLTINSQTAPGATQVVQISLTVSRPCVLQTAPANLAFASSVLQPDPPGQSVTLREVGNCARPVSWTVSADASSSSWLQCSAASGTDTGSGSAITIHVDTKGLLPGRYNGQITLSAIDGVNAPLQNSPGVVPVTLTALG